LIPLRDANPVRSVPIVNRLLLAINLVAWIYVVYLSRQPGALEAFFDRYSFDWLEFTSRIARGDLGIDTFVPLLSHMFLHGGWLHVIGNMLYLWIFGDNIEDRLGHIRYLFFYLACGFGATLTHAFFNAGSNVPAIGASGAIAGVLGAYLVLFPKQRVTTLIPIFIFITVREIPAVFLLGFWIVMQLFFGAASMGGDLQRSGGVAYFAHIGGFVAGMILITLLGGRRPPPRPAAYRYSPR
jgi:membrane associated rhomboid family serine protease